jgi:hypothetical protein
MNEYKFTIIGGQVLTLFAAPDPLICKKSERLEKLLKAVCSILDYRIEIGQHIFLNKPKISTSHEKNKFIGGSGTLYRQLSNSFTCKRHNLALTIHNIPSSGNKQHIKNTRILFIVYSRKIK